MNHFASPAFWDCYKQLPDTIRALADKNFSLLKANPQHPSLHFKKIGRYRSVRVGETSVHLRSKLTTVYCGFGSAITLHTID